MNTNKCLKFALISIRKDLFSSIFKIIQITVAFIILAYIIKELGLQRKALNLINGVMDNKEIYILREESFGAEDNPFNDNRREDAEQLLNMILNQKISVIQNERQIHTEENEYISLVGVTADFFNDYDISVDLSKEEIDEYFSNEKIKICDMNGSTIPVIAGADLKKNHKIGDVLEDYGINYKIIGFAKKDSAYIMPFQDYYTQTIDDSIIYPYFFDLTDDRAINTLFYSCFFKGSSYSEIEKILDFNNEKHLFNLSVKNYSQQLKNTKITYANNITLYGFFGLALLIFSLIGMTSTMLNRIIDNLFEYSVNLLCGATMKDIYRRVTFEFLIIFVMGVVVTGVLYKFSISSLIVILIAMLSYLAMRLYLSKMIKFETLVENMSKE